MRVNRRSFTAGLSAALLAPCRARAASVTDAAGRAVPIPAQVTRVFPAGPPAAILLYTLAPDLLLGWPRANRPGEREFLLPDIGARPEVGRLTGRGNTANLEVVLALKPDLILDVGSTSATFVSLADRVQQQTGIPYALLDGRFVATQTTYRTLGALTGRRAEAENLADYTHRTLTTITERTANIPAERRPRVYYARGPRGLETALGGSINVETIELLARNVADGQKGGLANVSIEQVLLWNPDVIITIDRDFAAGVRRDPAWASVNAVRAGAVHLSPKLPFGGRFPVSLGDLFAVLWAKLLGHQADVQPAVEAVILQVRGPRVIAALLVGMALAVAGTAFQGLFRNPLVSPDILGASSGAALGAVLGIYFSLGVIFIQTLAFLGGLVAVGAVYLIGSMVRTRDPILVLVLTGVVVGALLGAGVGLVKYLADPYNQLPAMTFWLLGSLAATGSADLVPLLGPVAVGTLVLLALRWRMNVMSLPDEEARALGVATGPMRIAIVAAATLVTAASVATAGIIGWVGLVVPHLARTLVGPDFSRLMPAAAILGGGYLLLIDTIARSAAPVEIPLGILTAVIGTPFFIWLLAHMQRTWS